MVRNGCFDVDCDVDPFGARGVVFMFTGPEVEDCAGMEECVKGGCILVSVAGSFL